MNRADALLLMGLMAAWPAQAGEALDAEFLQFLAEEAQDAAQGETDQELVAWLRDWWTPAEEHRGASKKTEEKP